jgi:hypothetical protein
MNFVSETKSNYIDELKILQPLFVMQQELSHVPKENELLIEHIETKDGFHLLSIHLKGGWCMRLWRLYLHIALVVFVLSHFLLQ